MRILLLAAATGNACRASELTLPAFALKLPELTVPSVDVRSVSSQTGGLRSTYRPAPLVKVFDVCGGVIEYQEPAPLGLIDLFGSARAFRQVLSSTSVEIVELKPTTDFFTAAEEYADRRVVLPASDASELRAVLSNDAAFDWLYHVEAESRTDFRVKFKQDGQAVSLDISLYGRYVRLVSGGEEHSPVRIEAGYAGVAAIIERYFPGALPAEASTIVLN